MRRTKKSMIGYFFFSMLICYFVGESCSAALIPKSAWRLVLVDSEETVREDGAAENAFDGSTSTIWHTQWSSAAPSPPHEIRIDLGAQYQLTEFRYLPRQDGSSNGRIGQYEFYVSTDGVNWGSAAASGTFVNDASEKVVPFSSKTGQFVRLRALSEVNGRPWTSMAELSLADITSGTVTSFFPDWKNITNGPFNLQTPAQVVNPVLTAHDVTDVPADFVADPFLFREGSLWYMFFEVLKSNTGLGVIGLAQSYDGFLWQYKQIVLSESFHLSFPMVFKLGDVYYMIPETYQKSEVRLYRATNFPYGWTYAGTLISGRYFVDPQVFYYNNKWWMFVSTTGNSNCYLYYSSNLTAGWLEHPASPIVRNDATKARGGGRAFVFDSDRIIRVAQNTGPSYGAQVRAFEVDLLTENVYQEHEIAESPILKKGVENWSFGAAHQFDPWWDGYLWICSADGHSGDGKWTIGIYVAQDDSSPNGIIDLPQSNVTITKGSSVNFSGSGSDSDNDLPLTYRWNFGAGSGLPDSTTEDPGAVHFNSPGTFTVTLTVTDGKGISDPTPDTRTIVVAENSSGLISKSAWRLVLVDSEETVREDGAAENAFDGSTSTIWHTQWSSAAPSPPHEIRIDLGAQYQLTEFRYLPRQDGSSNGRIGQYEFYVSTDGVNWGSAAASGTFVNDASEKVVPFSSKTGQFVRLRALSEVNGRPWTSMAELSLAGSIVSSGNQPPNGQITLPALNVSIQVGGSVTFACSGTDAENNLPLQYKWQFGSGSGVADKTVKDPGAVQFNNIGVFTVTLTVSDSLGNADATPDTRTVTVTNSGAALIPKNGWVLRYCDSQEVVGENGAATNAFDGNASTIWHTEWLSADPAPPHEIQIDLGASYLISSFRYLPRQDGAVNGGIKQYEFYVSADGINWGTVSASGSFARSTTEKDVTLSTSKSGRYIRLRVLSELNSKPWTSVAEISLIGTLN